MYVSVTKLKLKSIFKLPLFLTLVARINKQVTQSRGNIDSENKRINGHFCTLTHWESKNDMLAFRNSGAHGASMNRIGRIAKATYFHGFESEKKVDWDEALQELEKKYNQ